MISIQAQNVDIHPPSASLLSLVSRRETRPDPRARQTLCRGIARDGEEDARDQLTYSTTGQNCDASRVKLERHVVNYHTRLVS